MVEEKCLKRWTKKKGRRRERSGARVSMVRKKKGKESDTEGYCCISSLSSCLASENQWRRVVSGLLSSTSFFLAALDGFISSPSVLTLTLFLSLTLSLQTRHLFLSSLFYNSSLSLFLVLCCLLVYSCDVQMSSSWKKKRRRRSSKLEKKTPQPAHS